LNFPKREVIRGGKVGKIAGGFGQDAILAATVPPPGFFHLFLQEGPTWFRGTGKGRRTGLFGEFVPLAPATQEHSCPIFSLTNSNPALR
jgi:hypothetical protein